METAGPSQWLWTEADFDRMPLSDTFIHAIGFAGSSLLLDIDFITHAELPAEGGGYANWWLAPATWRFENVTDVIMNLEPHGGLVTLDVLREQPAVRPDGQRDWLWTIEECASVGFSFRATGFTLFVRAPGRKPHEHKSSLSLAERGGIFFACEIP